MAATMSISFHGAAREVTGSCHLLQVGDRRILLDCGLIQGGKERHARNREPFPFDPERIDAVVLSHAHIDHAGRLPLLVRRGFSGPIFCTAATARLCAILLPDSARIQQEDAAWKIKRLRKQGRDSSWVSPLYTEEDARTTLELLRPVDFDAPARVARTADLTFVSAGHILGAAIVQLEVNDRRIVFSGDLGVEGARLIGPPDSVPRPDILLIESTYGNRVREESVGRTERLYEIVARTLDRRGKVIIPAFAVGRTQEIVARLNDLVEDGRLAGLRVYVDSPMAVRATRAFARHAEAYSDEARKAALDDPPFEFPGLRLVSKVEESKELNALDEPCVIISASGMCTAGRIKHHLKHNISDPRSTVLFVGYQAAGSLGRLILDGVSPIRIFGDWYPVKASVERIEGFSAHADRDELLRWFGALGGSPARTFVVHGEEQAALALASGLEQRFSGVSATVPSLGESYPIDDLPVRPGA